MADNAPRGILQDIIDGVTSLAGYPNAQGAAVAALRRYNPQSIATNKEMMGSIIGIPHLRYWYLAPTVGEPDHMMVAGNPLASAYYHTHATSAPGRDNENLSDEDMAFAAKNRAPIFLGTPSTAIQMFDPATHYWGPPTS